MKALQDLARAQIKKHGVDRYPTVQRQLLKLVAELGELSETIALTDYGVQPGPGTRESITGELCDVALSLAELANKLGVDLLSEVTRLVKNDERRFN